MDILVMSFSESIIFFCFPCKKSFPILVPVQLLLPWHIPCQSLSLYSSPQLGCRFFGTECVTYTRVINSWYICKALDLTLKSFKQTQKRKRKTGCNINLSFCLPETKKSFGKTLHNLCMTLFPWATKVVIIMAREHQGYLGSRTIYS